VSNSVVSNFYLSKYVHKNRIYPGIFRIHPKYPSLPDKTHG
jgi:hypothetical protein